MHREISDKVFSEQTVSLCDDAGRSSAIDRTASYYNDVKEKVKKLREPINTGKYDMTRMLQNTYLVSSSLNFKVCLKILIPVKKLPILPTLIWKNLIFKYC